MTLITWNNGGPLFRDGQVASEQGCCCGGACCINGVADPTKTTRAQCEMAGGTWNAGRDPADPCWCCSYRYACLEEVVGSLLGEWEWTPNPTPAQQEALWSAVPQIPTSQPPGTVTVFADPIIGPYGGGRGCAGTEAGQQYGVGDIYSTCTEKYYSILHTYYRIRLVASCDECVSVAPVYQYTEPRVTCCDDSNGYPGVERVVANCDECAAPEFCADFGLGAMLSRTTAISCVALSDTTCSVRDGMTGPPRWSDCLEQTGVSMCANDFP